MHNPINEEKGNMHENCTATTAAYNDSVTTQNTSTILQCDQPGRVAYPLFIVIYSILFLVGLILNSVILWFHCCRPQRNVSRSLMIFLKNLTAADLLLCLSLPLRIIHYATSSVTIHLIYCSFGASMLFLNMYGSIFFMGYIALNRYLKVVHPLRTCFLLTVRAACITSTTTWLLLLAAMMAYFIPLLKTNQRVKSADCSCEELHSQSVKLVYKAVHLCALVTFLLVFLSMLFSYYSAYHKVLQAQQRQPYCSSSKKLLRSRRKMLMLICIFCISFIPYHIVRLPVAFQQESNLAQSFYYPLQLTTMVSVLNVCLDPLVYYIFSKDFRDHLRLRLRNSRIISQKVNENRRRSEHQQRTKDIKEEVSFSTTSRLGGNLDSEN
ncbi:PREDICTED: P2Y purinoceptor 14-like isoform X1 [Cyprinodon variegatus]|uniref:P2Y purinoceptor 14-like n=2 Tax=Cyprinodon variegatus TaxID=28743 RepID=A0A3Q2EBL5_CYPVA|nr:PREDICTED: P2Y purinoceptor 14-like isoform X1 [Cyprinodon variegatus]